MASAIQHYREAEDLLAVDDEMEEGNERRALVLARAHVHALLAVAGATALQSYARVGDDDSELDDWAETAGGAS